MLNSFGFVRRNVGCAGRCSIHYLMLIFALEQTKASLAELVCVRLACAPEQRNW